MANINHFDFKNYRVFETEIAGRKLTVETGKMAQLANGSCLVRYGDTAVLVTATASAKPRDGIDFFPLSVDFEERLYAVGRIPGSFMQYDLTRVRWEKAGASVTIPVSADLRQASYLQIDLAQDSGDERNRQQDQSMAVTLRDANGQNASVQVEAGTPALTW